MCAVRQPRQLGRVWAPAPPEAAVGSTTGAGCTPLARASSAPARLVLDISDLERHSRSIRLMRSYAIELRLLPLPNASRAPP